MSTSPLNSNDVSAPGDWQSGPLSDYVEPPDYGYTDSASSEKIGPRFLRISDIRDGKVDWDVVPYCACPPDVLAKKRLESGDIVVARIGATTGKSFIIEASEESSIFASYLIRIRARPDRVLPKYLYYYMQSPLYWAHIDSHKDDRLKGGVNIPVLLSLPVVLPPRGQQERIVSALNHLQAACTSEARQRINASELKRVAMRELFTRGLREEPQKELQFGRSPESWRLAVLSDVAEVQTGAAKGRKLTDDEIVEVPYLRVANVQDGHLDLSEMKALRIRRTEIERYRLRKGDVVLTEGGDFDKLGRGFIWRGELSLCIHQNHVFAVRTDRTVLDPEFFAYLAQSPYGKAYFLQVAHKTTNLACINSNKLKAFPVLLPTLEEQRDIVSILQGLDQKLDIHKKKLAVFEDLFRVLLHKLMTGDISVSDLDLSALEETPAKVSA